MSRPATKRVRFFRRAAAMLCVVVAGLIVLTISSCSMPGPKATPAQISALARETIKEPSAPSLSYLHAGDSALPRVIYIHGTPGNADGWADYLVSPVPGLEAVAVDRLGFGKSGPIGGGGEPSFAKQAAAIAPLLVARDGRWPILVGHSLGGPIAAWLAAEHPDKVSGLVIVAGSLNPALEDPGVAQQIATTGFVRYFLPRTLDNSMGELDDAQRQTTLLAPLLASIRCPVIVIHGREDTLVPYANTAYIQSKITGAASVEVLSLDGQGHFVPWERAEMIRDAVVRLHAGIVTPQYVPDAAP